MRLEVYIPNNTTRLQSSSLTLTGRGKDNTELVLYPFVPMYNSNQNILQRIFIEPRYGDTHTVRDLTIKSQQPNGYFETYPCVLKNAGVANAIRILGTVRNGFWDEMVVGKTVWYGWSLTVSGEVNTISSVDQNNSIIYITNNISASVSNDTQGSNVNFGTEFKQDIPESDYVAHGGFWWVGWEKVIGIGGTPAASSGSDYALNITNVHFENLGTQVYLTMGDFVVNTDNLSLKKCEVGISLFTRSRAGNRLNISNELSIEDAGYVIKGTLLGTTGASGLYGSGGYLHDNVIVNCTGTLRMTNNSAASWRQYSSGYSPINPGDQSYYANIIDTGSVQYTFLMSNTMPTVIDYIEASSFLNLRHDITINGGTCIDAVNWFNLDFGTGQRSAVFNNCKFYDEVDLQGFYNASFGGCEYYIKPFSELDVLIHPADNTVITGGEIKNGGSVSVYTPGQAVTGTEGSRFIYGVGKPSVSIDGLIIPPLNFYLVSGAQSQQPYYQKDYNFVINNCDVNCRGFMVDGASTAGGVSNTISGSNTKVVSEVTQHLGSGFIQSIQGKQGTISKTIASSASYLTLGTISNVLEIDFEHDEYQCNGTINAIICPVWVGSSKASATPHYGRNIRLVATGGNITINTFDASLRPTSNIIGTNGTVITPGNHIDLTVDNDYIFKTGGTVLVTNQLLATANGVTTSWRNVLPQLILEPSQTITLKAGAINVNADSNGVINHADVVGYVDYYTGKWQVIFTSPPANTTPIYLDYGYPDTWRNTGGWII